MYLLRLAKKDFSMFYPHHNLKKYPNQKLFIVQIRSYFYYVPFVEDQEIFFLKNIIPSRKYQKKYLIGAKYDS